MEEEKKEKKWAREGRQGTANHKQESNRRESNTRERTQENDEE